MSGKRISVWTAAVFVIFLWLPFAHLFGALDENKTALTPTGITVVGVPGQADRRAVIQVLDLLQTSNALSPVSEAGEVAPEFMRLPAKRPIPPEAVGRWQETVVSPPLQIPGALLSSETPAPTASFAALGDNNTRIPPDVHGAAGPSHLMTTLNTQVRIQNRSGGIISTVPLFGATGFWASLGTPSPFDPKVLYDPFANRWMFTAVSNSRSAASSVLMGVSQTSDPTGAWNLYRIDADPTNLGWADYPSMGFNKNWIVVNVNLFAVADDAFIRSDNYAFNKADLYAGGTGLFTLLSDTTGGGAITPALTYDTTVATMYMLEDWFGNSGGSGFLRLSTITGPVGSEVYTTGVAFPSTPNPWEDIPGVGFVDFAPQSGSARKIMNNDARMQNTVYRNGFLWCAHTVFLPAGSGTRSSAQWWKINPAGAVSQRGRLDDGSGNLFYAFPSIAVNKNDAVLIGYSRFSAAQFASGNYAYRISSDPANTLRNDTVLKAGEAKYDKDFGSGRNRWGDYTNTVVDPVNDVDMWSIQQYAETPSGGFDRWGTWWGQIPEPADSCDNDTVKPAVVCPAGLIQDTDPGQCAAAVTFSATASDNCALASLVCVPPSGSTFPAGTTPVTCIAADSAGNADTCMFTVTVSDTEKPLASCPANITVSNAPGQCAANVNYTANVTDNCPGTSIACTPPSGSSFPVGTTTVTCIATDASGNKDTCQFTIMVGDTEPPVANCPANITVNADGGNCSAVVNYTAAVTDNCPGATISCNPASGSTFPTGTTFVSCIASQATGFIQDTCFFSVTVVDNGPPVVTCPSNITADNDPNRCDAVVNFTASAADNCPGVILACTPPSGSSFPVGVSGVECVATDAAGLKDSCQFSVTVNDTSKPAVFCPADFVAFRSPAQCDSVVANFTASASDNCPEVSLTCAPSSGSAFPLGVSNVVCTAADATGNQDSCAFMVTVLKGDLNGDGSLTPADIVLVLNCAFLGTGNCPLCAVDFNCDGQLSPADVVLALNAAFRGIYFICTP